ncbi:MAG: hypothetical protein OEZ22_08065 [Spirochaetia bacterium]|nr:hypothetical protein [Spirochaetia bacterium]
MKSKKDFDCVDMKNNIQKILYEKHKGLNFKNYIKVISQEAKNSDLCKEIMKKKSIPHSG